MSISCFRYNNNDKNNSIYYINKKRLMSVKKSILITGGAGFVGSNLIKLLLSKSKFNIISLDNYSSGSKKKSY